MRTDPIDLSKCWVSGCQMPAFRIGTWTGEYDMAFNKEIAFCESCYVNKRLNLRDTRPAPQLADLIDAFWSEFNS